MSDYASIYIIFAMVCAVALACVGGACWQIQQPAHVVVSGIPAPVVARVGQIDDQYAEAVGLHFANLLLNWTDSNRAVRVVTASRMMSPQVRKRFVEWVKNYYPALEWFGKNQSFRVLRVAVSRTSATRWEVAATGSVSSSYDGLGESSKQVEITVSLELIEIDSESLNPYLVQIIGFSAPNLQ